MAAGAFAAGMPILLPIDHHRRALHLPDVGFGAGRELDVFREDIDRIEFATYKFASVMANPQPSNYFASKYSLPHAAAVLVVRGGTHHRAIDDEALHDPAIAAMRARVGMHEEPAMSARVPADKPAQVTLTLKDGRRHTHAVNSHNGDFQAPYTDVQLCEKFRDLAADVLSHEGVAQLEHAIAHCEDLQLVGDLAAIVSRFQKRV